MEQKETIIIGAGLAGLSTALHLGGDYLILEKEGRVGGLARTEVEDGFYFDVTGHWLHLRDERVKRLVSELLSDCFIEVERRAKIYIEKTFIDYPFQVNLAGLPIWMLRDCLKSAIQSAIMRAKKASYKPKNFLEYAKYYFGEGIARHFIVPYNTKIFGVHPSEITAEWCSRFVPIPNIDQVVDGALGFKDLSLGYNVKFLYPRQGGIEVLPKAFEARLEQSKILRNTMLRTIDVTQRTVEFGDEKVKFENLVSTIPLKELVAKTKDAPKDIMKAASLLRCSSLRYMNVALSVPHPLNGAHWLYIPEDRFPFYRVGCFSNVLPYMSPEGCSSLYVELRCDKPVEDRDAVHSISSFLKEIGSIEKDGQILFVIPRTVRYAYVTFDKNCIKARAKVLDWFASNGIYSIGRYGKWTYNSMEDAILDGIVTAEKIRMDRRGL